MRETHTSTNAALVYARQSLGNEASQDQQEQAGCARAEVEGWPIHGVYRDGVSASRHGRAKRADWTRLLAELDHPDVGVLWLWESSRGDRTLSTWADMLDRCREHGVRIYVETHGRLYDMSNARDWRSLAEDGVDNAYESEKISLRAKRSTAARAAAGLPHGRIPYGYDRKYELTVTGKRVFIAQVPLQAQAKIVKRIYRDLARGVSLRALSADLNAKAVPSPSGKPWTPSAVRMIALNAAYAGKRSHVPSIGAGRRAVGRRHDLGELIDGTWPALVDLALWHDVRTLLLDPRRKTSRPGRAKHLLSMIAVCGVCDGPLAVAYRGGDGTYCCRNANHLRVRQDDLEDFVTGAVQKRLADPDQYERIMAADENADEQLRVARDELAEAIEHLREIGEMFGSRRMSSAAFLAAEQSAAASVERATARVQELESPTSLRHLLGDTSKGIAACWRAMPTVARRQVVRILFERLAVVRAPSPGHRGLIKDRVEYTWRDAAATPTVTRRKIAASG